MSLTSDPKTLWLYTSLSSGSSQIVTATSRLETILKANKIEFKAVDVATDDKARSLWGRRAGKRKLPGLVRDGMVLGDINEVEEWNEYGEIKEMLALEGEEPAAAPAAAAKPAAIATTSSKETGAAGTDKPKAASAMSPLAASMQQLGMEAAEKAKELKTKVKPSSASTTSKYTTEASKNTPDTKDDTPKLDKSTAPPPSGTTDAEPAPAPEKNVSTTASATDSVAETKPGTGDESKSKAETESGPAVESSTLLSVESTPGQPADGSQTTRHRGSNVSAASAEEIAEVEQATKIEEHPVEEEIQGKASEQQAERKVSAGAAKQDLLQEDGTRGESDSCEEEGRDPEPRVKFAGEAPGQEMDRVKATLGAKGATENIEKQAAAEGPVDAPRSRSTGSLGDASDPQTSGAAARPFGDTKPADGTVTNATNKEDQSAPKADHDAASKVEENPQGTTKHEQPAAAPTEAGESVAD